MASKYNVAATLQVHNKAFIAGFAAAERAVQKFNATLAASSAATASAQSAMAASSAAVASSVGTMNNNAESAGRSMSLVSRESDAANRSLSYTAASAGAAGAAVGSAGNSATRASRGFGSASKAVELANRDLDRFNRTARGFAMTGLGAAAATIGAAFASFNTFGSYEQALAGVKKTVDATDREYRELDDTFREMSRNIPATYEEIASIAEISGQLGVEKENIVAFTDTMIRMGESTNLAAEDAAMAISRLMNIMGTDQSDVDRFASTIVELGNNMATTEEEIVNMSLRIGGMGKALGMSESDVIALAGSLSSLGIRAEMGGSAISTIMSKAASEIQRSTETGEQWAEVMGMSIEEVQRLFEEDAYGALIKMVEGLEEVDASGGNVDETLRDLGVTEIRQLDVMKRLTGASDDLAGAQAMANGEWETNNALVEESTKRFETFFSQVEMAWNGVKNIFANVGEVFVLTGGEIGDAIVGVIDYLEELTNGFVDADGNVTELGEAFVETAKKIGGISVTMGAVGAAFMMFGPYGAVTVAVLAGLGAIGLEVKDTMKLFSDDGYEAGMQNLANVADEETRKTAESYVEMKDNINEALKDLAFADSEEEAKQAREAIVGEVEQMVDEIVAALDEEQAQMEGLIEGYMDQGTEETREALQHVKEEYQRTYDELRQAAKEQGAAMNDIVRNEIDESGRITQKGLQTMQGIAKGLDGMFATAVASEVGEFRSMSAAFDEVANDSSKVQTALTNVSREAAESIRELNSARDEEISFIENSSGSQEAKNFLIDEAKLKYGNLTQAIIEDVNAMEQEAQAADESAEATKGLNREEQQLLNQIEGTTDGINTSADARKYLRRETQSMASAAADSATQNYELTESLHNQAKAINDNAEKLGTVPEQLNKIKESSADVAYELGQNFAKKLHDGTEQVDMGSAGTMKVDEFVAAVKNGEVTVAQAGMGMLNALRAELGMGSLTPEAEANILSYVEGLNAGGLSVQEFATSLGLDFKEGMLVDVGPEGTMTIESFKSGIESGSYGVLEVASVMMTGVEEAVTGDLSSIGVHDIQTLASGMESGIISVGEVMSILEGKVYEGAMIELGDKGTYTMSTLVEGLSSGELSVEEFMNGIKLMIEGGFDIDVSEEGAATGQSYSDGLSSGYEPASFEADRIRKAIESTLGETDGYTGGQNAMQSMTEGISNYVPLPTGQADTAKSQVEGSLGSTTDGGGGTSAMGLFMGNINAGLPLVSGAADVGRNAVEAIFGETDDGGGGLSSVGIFASGILGALGNATGAASETSGGVESELGETTDGDGGTASVNAFAQNIAATTMKAVNMASVASSKVTDVLASTTDGDGGQKAGSLFAMGIAGQSGAASSAGSRVSQSGRSGLQSGSNTYGLGQNFGSGFVRGIRSYIGAAISAAASLTRAAINAVKRTQKSNSPAKETMSLGDDFGDGFALAIEDKTKDAIKSARSMAKAALLAAGDEATRNQFEMDPVGMSAQIGSMKKTLRGGVNLSADATFDSDALRAQPANINVNVGGQEFETFSENIYDKNVKRLNFKDSYR